jgi:hypothetical protein
MRLKTVVPLLFSVIVSGHVHRNGALDLGVHPLISGHLRYFRCIQWSEKYGTLIEKGRVVFILHFGEKRLFS